MEVHHHSHHPKKWKEYITEFLMLFAAVTLGFFAENQREHLIEGQREKQYMQSLYEDLKKDTSTLNNIVKYDTIQTGKLDTTVMLINAGKWDDHTIKVLYRINLKTLGTIRYNLSERTSAQLKNAGGMRLVESRELSNKIAEYWVRTETLKENNDFIDNLKFKAREISYSIFDQKYYMDVTAGTVSEGANLMRKDAYSLTEYANRLTHINNSLKKVFLPSVDRQYKRAVELMSILKKEYELNENGEADTALY